MEIRSLEGTKRAQERHAVKANASFARMIDALAERLGLDRERAGEVAASALCVLQQRIDPGEGSDLEAQLPSKLRDRLFRCTLHVSERPQDIDRERFISMVAEDLSVPADTAERYVREVFSAVAGQISREEVQDVLTQLPPRLRDLWPPTVS